MLVCDRCNKQADQSVNTFPTRGATDLCTQCYQDLLDTLTAFLAALTFSVEAPDLAPAAPEAVALDALVQGVVVKG